MIICGDCREILPTLPANSVQCCVTSPPYWGLRDFGTAQWEDGGCALESLHQIVDGVCIICGARRIDSQLGLEATPEEYILKMVAVFREVWRMLRLDGTLWINLGDSYATSNPAGRRDSGLKPKDLCGIPWRLAFALQTDGWYLRSDIIWAKPNPMPESVTDRPTKAHEYIFLLTKAERYFYDAEAIREPASPNTAIKLPYGRRYSEGVKRNNDGFTKSCDSFYDGTSEVLNSRNKRSIWTIPTQPYTEAHFATFPEEIPKLCILAGSKPGDTILDPFAGSGTVGKVALEIGRKPILIELSREYIRLIEERTYVTPGFF